MNLVIILSNEKTGKNMLHGCRQLYSQQKKAEDIYIDIAKDIGTRFDTSYMDQRDHYLKKKLKSN